MLRLLVAALLLANLLFFTWSRGWLDSVIGVPARGEREPQRLANQVRPELVRLWTASELAAGAASIAQASASTAASVDAAASAASAPASPMPVAASAASVPVPVPVAAATPSASAAPASRPAIAASAAALPVATAASSATACLEAGPFNPAELAIAETAVRAALPAGSWSERKGDSVGEWMIYMGPYPDREWLERKKRELARIRGGVPQEEVSPTAELGRGISLGRYASQAAANTALTQYNTRGIRTARVVRGGPAPAPTWLRVAQADPALAARVIALTPVPGKGFAACSSR